MNQSLMICHAGRLLGCAGAAHGVGRYFWCNEIDLSCSPFRISVARIQICAFGHISAQRFYSKTERRHNHWFEVIYQHFAVLFVELVLVVLRC